MATSEMQNTPAYNSASRNVVARRKLGIRTEAISGAAPRMQQRRGKALVYLLAKTADVDVDDVRLGVEVVVPDPFKQHGTRDYLAGVAHQVLEQAKLPRLQLDRLAGALHGPRQQVHLEIANH